MHRYIKRQIYKETPILDYLASNPLKRPWDGETLECPLDMTPQ